MSVVRSRTSAKRISVSKKHLNFLLLLSSTCGDWRITKLALGWQPQRSARTRRSSNNRNRREEGAAAALNPPSLNSIPVNEKMWNRRSLCTSMVTFLATMTGLATPSDAFLVPTGPVDSSPVASSSTVALAAASGDSNEAKVVTRGNSAETSSPSSPSSSSPSSSLTGNVNFQDLTLKLDAFDTTVPVACWWPATEDDATNDRRQVASYAHRISVQRIGQLLAQWNFIPSFASRSFQLQPTLSQKVWKGNLVVGDSKNTASSFTGPVVILAHGYLGSRFDLSHLAETLSANGFLCLAPEYPESLAASYDRIPGLDRGYINQQLLGHTLSQQWKIQATSFGIVGHSLGTGTALSTGDESWARVLLAGLPRQRNGAAIPGNLLLIASMNDGAMSLARFGGKSIIPNDYALLKEEDVALTTTTDSSTFSLASSSSSTLLPRRAAWILESADAPNHISFLSAGVNDAMIDLLSPLLPVAQLANIPVLDFDRYQVSRDAGPTAARLHPVILRYLQQEMNGACRGEEK